MDDLLLTVLIGIVCPFCLPIIIKKENKQNEEKE